MSDYKGFKSVELRKPKRSMFDLSHEKRLSTRMGKLVPVFISETLPNDTFRVNTEVMLRFAPLLAPLMHRVNVFVHFFFIANRLLADWWEEFITNGRTGEETPPVPSYMDMQDVLGLSADLLDKGSLADYLGVPPIPDSSAATWAGRKLQLLPFLAYQKIWMDYYRDRNFVDDGLIDFPVPEGNTFNGDDATLTQVLTLRTRAWSQDYFTTAAINTQRGFEVLMPLQGSGTVTYLPESQVKLFDGTSDGDLTIALGTAGDPLGASGAVAGGTVTGRIENIDEVNLTSSEVSINDFRTAIALQSWLERNQLAGSRYNESIMAHFGRKTSDARLQRAEYLGGGKVVVQISEIMTTAYSEDADTNVIPPASMSGKGISFGNTNQFTYNCEEHGFIIGIMSVMPTPAYDQGLPRMFDRQTFLDYPFPSFAHLGEQAVHDYEIYMTPTSWAADEENRPIFGYQSRYSDWKNLFSTNHGDMRTGQSLEYWNLTRKFSAQPDLGESFVTFEDALQDRIFAVSGVDTLWCYIYNKASVIRSLPYFGTPSNL